MLEGLGKGMLSSNSIEHSYNSHNLSKVLCIYEFVNTANSHLKTNVLTLIHNQESDTLSQKQVKAMK